MNDVTFLCYHRKDDNMLETCVNSLRKTGYEGTIFIATDGVPVDVSEKLADDYGVDWMVVPKEQMHKRRATCKIEVLKNLMHSLSSEDETRILVSDVDIYFLGNPFAAFDEFPGFDLGLTTRGYQHLFPINGGIFYIRDSDRMTDWVDWHVEEIYKPTWPPYIQHRRKYNHEHYGLDWSVGQDFLIANWNQQAVVMIERNIVIQDVGPKYNYCPPTDTMGERAMKMAAEAATGKGGYVTLHLKSALKHLLYRPGVLKHATYNFPRGTLAWA